MQLVGVTDGMRDFDIILCVHCQTTTASKLRYVEMTEFATTHDIRRVDNLEPRFANFSLLIPELNDITDIVKLARSDEQFLS